MSLTKISWLLCAVFLFVASVNSFVTVAPGHERAFVIAQASLLAAGCTFGGFAVLLCTLLKSHWIHRSCGLAWTYFGFAMAVSLTLFLASVG